MLISFQKPHENVKKRTIAKWLKFVVKNAGIDVNIYTPHSIRLAVTSAVL